MRRLKILRYVHLFAGGAAGLLGSLAYNNISKEEFQITAADTASTEEFKITATPDENLETVLAKVVEMMVGRTSLMKHGFPSYDMLRKKDNYVLSYDRKNKNALWVLEHLTSENINAVLVRGKNKHFYEDETIPCSSRSTLEDYKHSGYDKGHLASAENYKFSKDAYIATFVLSNLAPQIGWFNQGIWNKLETHVRKLVEQYGSVYVCTGPLYVPREIGSDIVNKLPQQIKRKRKKAQNENENQEKKLIIYEVIGENNVAVPTHFFKIIVCETVNDEYVMEAYMIPNEPVSHKEDLSKFMETREEIEKYSGLELFNKLPSRALKSINGRSPPDDRSHEFENSNLEAIFSDSRKGNPTHKYR